MLNVTPPTGPGRQFVDPRSGPLLEIDPKTFFPGLIELARSGKIQRPKPAAAEGIYSSLRVMAEQNPNILEQVEDTIAELKKIWT